MDTTDSPSTTAAPSQPNRLLGLRHSARQGLRTAWYTAQYALMKRTSAPTTRPGEPPFRPSHGEPDMRVARREFLALMRRDRENVEAGLYPMPDDVRLGNLASAVRHAIDVFRDARAVDARRQARDGTEVRAIADAERYPTYYRQNFHYQSDGWLSDRSADLYDTQVEVLFTGAADAMRRMALAELVSLVRGQDQRQVRLLDVAGGNGRFAEQILNVFPRLRLSLLDLSPNYCDMARRRLTPWRQVDVIEGTAEAMPVDDASQDIVTSVYLFHELPPKVRPDVFRDIARVLKPGGHFVLADSLQIGDTPEIDGLLEYFPESFHEPYYRGYLDTDLAALGDQAGLEVLSSTPHFLTKVMVFRKA